MDTYFPTFSVSGAPEEWDPVRLEILRSGRSKSCHSEEIRGYLAVVGADSSQAQAVKRRNTSHFGMSGCTTEHVEMV